MTPSHIPNDTEATLERARADGRDMLRQGHRRVVICRSRTRAPGGWGAEIVRFFPLSEEIVALVKPRADSIVEELGAAVLNDYPSGEPLSRRTP